MHRLFKQNCVMAAVTIAMTFVASACGKRSDAPPQDVEEVLDRLGVDRTETPRIDPHGDDLPADYAPLGGRIALQRFAEVAFLGIGLGDSEDPLVYVKNVPDGNNNLVTNTLHSKPSANLGVWAEATGVNPPHFRWATTGDMNGDGAEELLIVYREQGDMFIRLVVVSNQQGGFATSEPVIVTDAGTVRDLKIVSGDFTGNGYADVAVGIAREDAAQVVYMVSDGATMGQAGVQFTLDAQIPDSQIYLKMAAANLDFDNGWELGIVLNELGSNPTSATATYSIRDDLARDAAELAGGTVRHSLGVEIHTARAADIAFGDITGDGRNEIILGGITNPSHLDPNETTYGHLIFALSDVPSGMEDLGGAYFDHHFSGANESGQGIRLNTAHINAVDVFGNGRKEVHLNQFVFEPLSAEGPWHELFAIPDGDLIYQGGAGNLRFEHNSSVMAVSDVTQDRRENIVFYSQDRNHIRVWGVDMIGGWSEQSRVETEQQGAQTPIWPVIIPTDVDDDGIVVQYSPGEYRLVFTEPVIIAALAAAPCSSSFGQSLSSCTTAFGEAESTTVSLEDSYTLSASATVGFSQEFSALGVSVGALEVLTTVEASATRMSGESYTLTKRVVHTTGPIEDSVLFTSIPMDQWTYTISSHPNPELIGGEIVVSLPREPIQAMVTRELFNASVLDESVKIDADVFAHVPGDPRSYPGRAERNALLARHVGLQSAEVDVGQGGGTVGVELSVFEEVTEGSSYSVSFSRDVKATAGVVVLGVSVGYGQEHSISFSNGQESTYTGTVGNLDEKNFASNRYSFGLFTYVVERNGQQFETLNYWTHFQN
jgi:hypothetical protein